MLSCVRVENLGSLTNWPRKLVAGDNNASAKVTLMRQSYGRYVVPIASLLAVYDRLEQKFNAGKINRDGKRIVRR